ncbi:hypothetical protein N7468_008118 [Penicillium chermesinum]|uniref:Ribonucleases P/MRP subunit Pop8-like domain-containing protein n=1 Tax=Penicillium chermesinum TaxID=63820 RepID=A0A9W9NP61_9EURO|nr:uncharacterized protein N7468_008118 [Penicillium chermesinum]KAJ5223576.1 hypothetical protein N7468_008118 [Penicillium chermesinum]
MGDTQNTKMPGAEKLTGSSKRKASDPQNSGIQFTSRNPPWTYLRLQLHLDNALSQPLDALSARTYLSSAFSQYLGLTGTSISVDILKVEHNSSSQPGPKGDYVWIRIPCGDAAAVVAALSSWVGGSNGLNYAWRVCAKGNYLSALAAGSGADLFVP